MARFDCKPCNWRGREAIKEFAPGRRDIWRWCCPQCGKPADATFSAKDRDLLSPDMLAIAEAAASMELIQ